MRSTATAVVAATLAGLASACSTPGNYIVTFYGYPDNDPPGPAIAYDCGRGNRAGGRHLKIGKRSPTHTCWMLTTFPR